MIFNEIPIVCPQRDPLRVFPGPKNQFYVEYKIGFNCLLKILYSFSSKNTFNNTAQCFISMKKGTKFI